MKLNGLEKMVRENDGYSVTVRHGIEIDPDRIEERYRDLVESTEFLFWKIVRSKDELPEGFYNWIYTTTAIDLYVAGVRKLQFEDNKGNIVVFDIQEIYEKEICEDF